MATAVPTPRKIGRWGILVTVLWLTALGVYAFQMWPVLLAMKPSEAADFFAGAFAPLAFMWLVLGFFQQGDELRQSTAALWLQGEELRNSVEQQRMLVEVSREQIATEREALESERIADARRSLPRLSLDATGSVGSAEGQRAFSYRLINTGPECSDVAVHLAVGRVYRATRLGVGNELSFSIEAMVSSPFADLRFPISFTDARGLQSAIDASIEGTERGPGAARIIPPIYDWPPSQ